MVSVTSPTPLDTHSSVYLNKTHTHSWFLATEFSHSPIPKKEPPILPLCSPRMACLQTLYHLNSSKKAGPSQFCAPEIGLVGGGLDVKGVLCTVAALLAGMVWGLPEGHLLRSFPGQTSAGSGKSYLDHHRGSWPSY